MNNNILIFDRFIEQYTSNDNSKATHIYYNGENSDNSTNLIINNSVYQNFINLFKKIAFNSNITIIEKINKNNSPIILCINLICNDEENEYNLDEYYIKKIIKMYVKSFLKYFEIINKNQYYIAVLKNIKPKCNNNKNINHFYIFFYGIVINTEHKYFIYDEVNDNLRNEDIFKNIYEHDEEYDNIIKLSYMINKDFVMYGSNNNPYYLKYIYDFNLNNINIKNFSTSELVHIFTTKNYNNIKIPLKKKYNNKHFQKKINKNNEKYMDNLNNINKNIMDKNITDKNITDVNNNKINNNIENIDKEYGQIMKILNILSKNRLDDYKKWVNIGQILYNINSILYCYFLNFTKKSKKYNENICYEVWNNFTVSNLSIGSLFLWGKKDNEEEYYNIIREQIKEKFTNKTFTHKIIAEISHEMYKYEYKCVHISKNVWYEFKNHKWNHIESGHNLLKKIMSTISTEF